MSVNSRMSVAVHALAWLAGERRDSPNEDGTSTQIAASVNTNPVVIRRLLGDLRSAGLVRSTAGRHGGWTLTRAADRITLADVYRAVGRPQFFALPVSSPDQRCFVGSGIRSVLEGVYRSVDDAVERELAGTTLAEVLEQTLARTASGRPDAPLTA